MCHRRLVEHAAAKRPRGAQGPRLCHGEVQLQNKLPKNRIQMRIAPRDCASFGTLKSLKLFSAWSSLRVKLRPTFWIPLVATAPASQLVGTWAAAQVLQLLDRKGRKGSTLGSKGWFGHFQSRKHPMSCGFSQALFCLKQYFWCLR